ncbi:MAG: SDR family oxidoreductase [Acetobacterales bacterium]
MARAARTALVTGSGRKIGRAIALTLAEAGFNIVVNGSTKRDACEKVADEVRAMGPDAMVGMADIGNREQVQAMATAALDEFGVVDVLVNNAAVRPNGGILDLSEEEWERVFNIDFKSSFWLSRAFLPGMVERGWGRIVNFTGMNAQQGYPGKPHVTVAKHASWGFTKSLAKEFGPKGITANIISPGTIVDDGVDFSDDARLTGLLEKNPAGRLGRPGDIAGMVGYLVSEQAGFVNGQLLQVNGGVVG